MNIILEKFECNYIEFMLISLNFRSFTEHSSASYCTFTAIASANNRSIDDPNDTNNITNANNSAGTEATNCTH